VKRLLKLKRKEVLYLPQHKFQNFYAIQKGALKTYQQEANGKELIRGFYFAGEILGYEAIATGHYLFSAAALTDTLICEVPYDDFLKLVHAKPALQKHSLYLISQQLHSGSYLASTTAEQRLAAFLLDLSKRLRPEAPSVFNLFLSRQDIGSYLSLTAETISRLLSKLQKNQILKITQKRLQILEPDQLQLIAEGLFC
jgi:CRP/FNR family transcriptional regulator